MKVREAAGCLLLVASLGVAGVAGQAKDDPDHGVVFIYPTADQIYNLMDTVNVTYTSPFPTPNLYTFCDGGGRQVFMQRAPGYNATVPIMLNFTSATPCWFNLRPGTEPGFGANSKSFTIIGQERGSGSRVFGPSETPTITPPPYTTSGGGGTNPTETSGSPSTGQVDAGPGSGSSLSAGASAGIGVGVAVGVLALAGGVFFRWRRIRSRGQSQATTVSGNSGDGGEMGQKYADDKRYVSDWEIPQGSGPSPPLEMGTANDTAELPSHATGNGTAPKTPPRYEMAG